LESRTDGIRIVLVDGLELFLAGLSALIQSEKGLTVVGHAADRAEALDAARLRPDIILLELFLGKENSLDFLPDLLRIAEGARVLIVTEALDPELHLRAVRLGAMGVVLKTEPAINLFKAIHKVHSGELWLRRSILARVMNGFLHGGVSKPADPESLKIATLTSREIEVVVLIGQGLRNKNIGERLFISETTVRHHLTSIFDKLGVADRLELMMYAYQHGLARVPQSFRPLEQLKD
jgi:DNA-binding NarL/FixJ family response regulator